MHIVYEITFVVVFVVGLFLMFRFLPFKWAAIGGFVFTAVMLSGALYYTTKISPYITWIPEKERRIERCLSSDDGLACEALAHNFYHGVQGRCVRSRGGRYNGGTGWIESCERLAPDREQGLAYIAMACEMGALDACLTQQLWTRTGSAETIATLCTNGSWRACAWMSENTPPAEANAAEDWLGLACERGYLRACHHSYQASFSRQLANISPDDPAALIIIQAQIFKVAGFLTSGPSLKNEACDMFVINQFSLAYDQESSFVRVQVRDYPSPMAMLGAVPSLIKARDVTDVPTPKEEIFLQCQDLEAGEAMHAALMQISPLNTGAVMNIDPILLAQTLDALTSIELQPLYYGKRF